eukprot:TRINITY_DN832_c3_g2_i1.p1 TRINITY_DN832_c3_g2~~TRINITY_DN832_c3_g2_i1.p1  ORF type:complete len:507 (+),score=206.47 TRINITY_DN832_c3_g2_i1:86-1606(+)
MSLGLLPEFQKQAEVQQLEDYARKRIKHLLALEDKDVEDIVKYLMSLRSAEEVEEYLVSILGRERKAVPKFISSFNKQRMQTSTLFRAQKQTLRSANESPPDASVTIYRKSGNTTLSQTYTPPVKPVVQQPKKAKNQQNKDNQNNNKNNNNSNQNPNQPSKKQKTKFTKLEDYESNKRPVTANRTFCGCNAQEHDLIGNCLLCGKIVCAYEGEGPCLSCHAEDAVKLSSSYNSGAKNSGGQNPRKLEGLNLSQMEALLKDTEKDYKSGKETKERFDYVKAMVNKERLMEYSRTSAVRTVVFDDQSDWFSSDQLSWLSPEERQMILQEEENRRKAEEEAKNKVVVSLDFAGRQVVKERLDDKMESWKDRNSSMEIKKKGIGAAGKDGQVGEGIAVETKERFFVNPAVKMMVEYKKEEEKKRKNEKKEEKKDYKAVLWKGKEEADKRQKEKEEREGGEEEKRRKEREEEERKRKEREKEEEEEEKKRKEKGKGARVQHKYYEEEELIL